MVKLNFNKITVENYSLDITLSTAQTFVWDKTAENIWIGKTLDDLIFLRQPNAHVIEWQTYPVLNNKPLVEKYLRLDFNFPDLIAKASNDEIFMKAYAIYSPMWLLQQNIYESIITWIISANNSFRNIKNSINKLSTMYGKKFEVNGNQYSIFPDLNVLASQKTEDIKKASVGYRAYYIIETAKQVVDSKFDFLKPGLEEEQIREQLLEFKGVGNKVADCILAFGYGFDNIAPVDVWVSRILNRFYGVDKNLSYKKMRQWAKENMYGYASWVSQYLFEYIRVLDKK